MGAIHVLAPALWIPPERHSEFGAVRMPALARMLGRAKIQPIAPIESFNTRLFALFGIQTAPEADLPVAAATHWTDFTTDHEGNWLRVDPVHLRPDLGQLLMFDAHHFSITASEAVALLSDLNPHLREYGLEIVVGAQPSRWYLRTKQPLRLRTTPPHWLNGKHVDPWLMRGEDAQFWQRLITGLQMLLHRSAVNAAREERQLPSINSLWPWGAGSLPDRKSSIALVASDNSVAIGLARSANIRLIRIEEVLTRELFEVDVLVVPNAGAEALYAGDANTWRTAIEALDREFFATLVNALRRWRTASVHVHLPGGVWTLESSRRWQFWRRGRIPEFHAEFPLRP